MKRIISILAVGLITISPVMARGFRVRAHTRHYKNGKVVTVKSHSRASKNK